MRVSPMWPNAVPHMCGILLVLRHLASVLWMYHITINIHNIHPIHDGSMALMLFITLNNNCSFMNNPFATNIMQWARVCKNSKMNYESKYGGNILLSIFITYIPSMMEAWPLCYSWSRTTIVLSWTTLLQQTLCKWARVYKNSKMIYESKYRGNVLLSIFITYISFIMKVWPLSYS